MAELDMQAKLGLKDDGFSAGVKSAKDRLGELSKEFGVGEKKLINFKAALRNAKRDFNDLSITYMQLSDEMKNSDFGRAMAKEIEIARAKLAELTDKQADYNREIKQLASDTRAWNTAKEGIDLLADSIQAASGIIGMFAKDEKTALKMLNAVNAARSTANALIKIGNALQKESNLMQTINITKEKAAAAAKALSTKNTIAATVAQKAFNLAAKANPYMLIATTAIAAGAAIFGFIKNQEKSEKEQEKATEEAEKAKDAQEKYIQGVKSTVAGLGELKSKFGILTEQYKKLQSTAEKTKWIKENKSAFDDLKISINSVSDAERAFSDMNEEMVKAFTLRIRLANLYKKAAEQMQRSEETKVTEETNANGLPNGKYNIDEAGYKYTTQQILDVEAELKQLEKELGLFKGGNGSNGKSPLQTVKEKMLEVDRQILNLEKDESISIKDRNDKEKRLYQEKENAIENYIDTLVKTGNVTLADKKLLEQLKPKLKDAKNVLKKLSDEKILIDAEEKYADTLRTISREKEEGLITDEEYNSKLVSAIKKYIEELNKVEDLSDEIKSKIEVKINGLKIAGQLQDADKIFKELRDFVFARNSIVNKSATPNKLYVGDAGNDVAKSIIDEIRKSEKPLFKDLIDLIENAFKEGELNNLKNYNNGSLDKIISKMVDETLKGYVEEQGGNWDEFKKEFPELLEEQRKGGYEFVNKALGDILNKIYNALLGIQGNPNVSGRGDASNYKINSKSSAQLERDYNGLFDRKTTKTDDYSRQYESLLDQYRELENLMNNFSGSDVFKKMSDELKQKFFTDLQNNFVKLESEIDNVKEKLQDSLKFQIKLDGIQEATDKLSTFASAIQNVGNYIQGWRKIDEEWDKSSGWEKFAIVMEKVVGTIELFNTALGIANTIQSIANAKTIEGASAKSAEASATVTKTAADATAVGTMTTETVAAKALEQATLNLAAAQIFQAHAGIPFAGVGIATGLASGMMGAMAGLTATSAGLAAFANGGIVPGNSFTGDRISASLNSGEMVLNTTQQSNLFKLLDGSSTVGGTTGGQVEFKLRGQELVGLINNYNGKISKIR